MLMCQLLLRDTHRVHAFQLPSKGIKRCSSHIEMDELNLDRQATGLNVRSCNASCLSQRHRSIQSKEDRQAESLHYLVWAMPSAGGCQGPLISGIGLGIERSECH